jgi:hypothetical protein
LKIDCDDKECTDEVAVPDDDLEEELESDIGRNAENRRREGGIQVPELSFSKSDKPTTALAAKMQKWLRQAMSELINPECFFVNLTTRHLSYIRCCSWSGRKEGFQRCHLERLYSEPKPVLQKFSN